MVEKKSQAQLSLEAAVDEKSQARVMLDQAVDERSHARVQLSRLSIGRHLDAVRVRSIWQSQRSQDLPVNRAGVDRHSRIARSAELEYEAMIPLN